MRCSITLAIAWLASGGAAVHAMEARSELTLGREFVFLTNALDFELLDGRLAVGGGMTLVSDYTIQRYGAQALVEYRGDRVSAGVAATFGPRQAGRGWASLDPHGEAQLTLRRWRLHADGGVLLRRIDATTRHAVIVLDQLQLHGAAEVTLDERWRAGIFALYSFFGPDPATPALRNLDLGLAVTLAGRPERWAVGGLVARRAGQHLWVELGAAGVVYANGRGAAVVPRAAMRVGTWRGVSIGVSCEVVVGIAGAAGETPREIGGLELEYER